MSFFTIKIEDIITDDQKRFIRNLAAKEIEGIEVIIQGQLGDGLENLTKEWIKMDQKQEPYSEDFEEEATRDSSVESNLQQSVLEGGESVKEIEKDLILQQVDEDCGVDLDVPFCCIVEVPGNLEVDLSEVSAQDIDIVATPKLECCKDTCETSCYDNEGNLICENLEMDVLRLIGCIQYNVSIRNVVSGILSSEVSNPDFNNNNDISCGSTVCVNNIVAACNSGLECPTSEEFEDQILEQIQVESKRVVLDSCPQAAAHPNVKFIRIAGVFELPSLA
ncbi:MAG: hypothetical protein ACQEQI_02980 [Bacillota bacterium]